VGRRDDPRARKVQRALDDLERWVRRGDIERAAAALGDLPAELRGAPALAMAVRFGAEVTDAHRRQDWARLAALGRSAVDAPELLTDDVGAVAWALMWGCGRVGDLPRARRMFARIEAETAARAPALARALAAWLGGGEVPAEALGVLPALATTPTRSTAPVPPPPTAPAEALPAVCALAATQPWAVVESTLGGRWALDGEVGAATRAAGFALAMREHLGRVVLGFGEAWAPLSLAARLAEAAPSLEAARPEVLELLRLTLPAAAGAGDRPPREVLHAVIRLGARDVVLRPMVLSAVATMAPTPAEWRARVALLRTVYESSREVEAWSGALMAYFLRPDTDDEMDPESWITSGLSALLASGGLAAWLQRRSPERDVVLEAVFDLVAAEDFERLCDQLWERADEPLRMMLSKWMAELIEEDPLAAFGGRLMEAGMLLGPIKAAQRAMFLRQQGRMLAYSENFLRLALGRTASEASARDAVERFVGGGGTIHRWLVALRFLQESGRMLQGDQLMEGIIARYAGDASSLAEAVLWIASQGAPTWVVAVFATPLRAAVGDGVMPMDSKVGRAMMIADEVAPLPKKRPPPKKKPVAVEKKKKPAAVEKKKPAAVEKKKPAAVGKKKPAAVEKKKKKPAKGGEA